MRIKYNRPYTTQSWESDSWFDCDRRKSINNACCDRMFQGCSELCNKVRVCIGIKRELNQLNSLHTNTYAVVIGNYCEYCVTNQRFKTMNVTPCYKSHRNGRAELLSPWNNEKRILQHLQNKDRPQNTDRSSLKEFYLFKNIFSQIKCEIGS